MFLGAYEHCKRLLMGANTLRASHFCSKKGYITSIIVCSKLKPQCHPSIILNKDKKLHSLYNNILEPKIHFDTKLILIQWLDEEDWIKSMYIDYIIYSFSMAIGLHLCGSMKHYQTKEN